MESGLRKMEAQEEGPRMFRVHGGQKPVLTQVLGRGPGPGERKKGVARSPGCNRLELDEPRGHLRAGLGQENIRVGRGGELG